MNETTKVIAKWIKRYNLAAEVRAKEAQVKALTAELDAECRVSQRLLRGTERQQAEINTLTAENDEHFKNIKALNADRLLAEAEVERLEQELGQCTELFSKHWPPASGCNGNLCASGHLANVFAENKALKAALEDLLDVQNGPPLIRDTEKWEEIVERGYKLLE